MDIKEIGAGAAVIIGGVVYGVSSGGLGEALSSEVRHVREVPYEERAAYMDEITTEFAENFEYYIVQTETFDYVGHSKFTSNPAKAMFAETVRSEERVPRDEIKKIKAQFEVGFCEQDEMTMFTKKGWSYDFKVMDGEGRRIFTVLCQADLSELNADGAIG